MERRHLLGLTGYSVGTAEDVEFGLRNGRMGRMPAHKDILGEQKAHLVATYVYSLSHVLSNGAAGNE